MSVEKDILKENEIVKDESQEGQDGLKSHFLIKRNVFFSATKQLSSKTLTLKHTTNDTR